MKVRMVVVMGLLAVSCTGAEPPQVVAEKPGLYGRIAHDRHFIPIRKAGDPANLSRPLLYGYGVSQRIPLVWHMHVARPRSGR